MKPWRLQPANQDIQIGEFFPILNGIFVWTGALCSQLPLYAKAGSCLMDWGPELNFLWAATFLSFGWTAPDVVAMEFVWIIERVRLHRHVLLPLFRFWMSSRFGTMPDRYVASNHLIKPTPKFGSAPEARRRRKPLKNHNLFKNWRSKAISVEFCNKS